MASIIVKPDDELLDLFNRYVDTGDEAAREMVKAGLNVLKAAVRDELERQGIKKPPLRIKIKKNENGYFGYITITGDHKSKNGHEIGNAQLVMILNYGTHEHTINAFGKKEVKIKGVEARQFLEKAIERNRKNVERAIEEVFEKYYG